MATEELFRTDSYLKSTEATVVNSSETGITTDRTLFYPRGGGQPGDRGVMVLSDQGKVAIGDTLYDRESGELIHIPERSDHLPEVGERVELIIDWERRHRLMRVHSALHLLCSIVPAPVTGGSIRDGSGRLDFDLPEPIDKEELSIKLNTLIEDDHPMSLEWITEEALNAQPELVRTLSVRPPTGSGLIRLVRFKGVDLQPCGGTHVASSAEIGPIRIKKIEKKGKLNRRITLELLGSGLQLKQV